MSVGLVVGGRYELRAQLGSGGYGTVWRAHDRTLRRDVAVKLISVAGPARDAILERFWREAHAVATLNHPNIVIAHDFGVHDDRAYLVMELIAGESLAGALAVPRPAGTGPFDVRRVARIGAQVAAGLAAAHAAGLVHRDLKPANLMMTTTGTIKIVDFGIARSGAAYRLTATGDYLGTLPYASPEQMNPGDVDGRSDLYSLGCVLFELATGRSPFDAESPAQWIAAHQNADPIPLRRLLPDAPAEFGRLIETLLAKDPAARPPGAATVRADLERIAGPVDGSGYGDPAGTGQRPAGSELPAPGPAPAGGVPGSAAYGPAGSPHDPAAAAPGGSAARPAGPARIVPAVPVPRLPAAIPPPVVHRPASPPPGHVPGYSPPGHLPGYPLPGYVPAYARPGYGPAYPSGLVPIRLMPARPAVVGAAGWLMVGFAGIAVVNGVLYATAAARVSTAVTNAFSGLRPAPSPAGGLLFLAIMWIVNAFVLSALGGGLLRGGTGARIWMWILTLPYAYFCFTAVAAGPGLRKVLTVPLADAGRPRFVHAYAQARAGVPGWFGPGLATLNWIAVLALVTAAILIMMPPAAEYAKARKLYLRP